MNFKIVLHNSLLAFTILSTFVIGFWLSTFIILEKPEEFNSTDLIDGEFIQFVFIGSSSCSFSNNEEIFIMISELIQEFESISDLYVKNFIFTGISTDLSALEGVDYLKKTGTYDEIISGISWYNTGLLQYIWDPEIGYASTPQILILRGKYDVISNDYNIFDIKKSNQLLKRYRGVDEIRNLYEIIFYSNIENIEEEFSLNK